MGKFSVKIVLQGDAKRYSMSFSDPGVVDMDTEVEKEETRDIFQITVDGFDERIATHKKQRMQKLLESQGNLDTAMVWRRTALAEAIANGDEEAVKLLIAAGADVNACRPWDTEWEQLDFCACRKAKGAKGKFCRPPKTPLGLAIDYMYPGIVKLLLDAGADVNGGTLCTPLTLAIPHRNEMLVGMLVAAGASVNQPSLFNESPLELAIVNYLPNSVQALIAAGADVNGNGAYRRAPLYMAIVFGFPVEPLLAAGAKVNCCNCLLFHHCLIAGNVDNVKCLLRFGIHIGAYWAFPEFIENETPLSLLSSAAGCSPVDYVPPSQRDGDYYAPVPSLQFLCRKVIRGHMMRVSSVNLFVRVPRLGITRVMESYLLFNQSV